MAAALLLVAGCVAPAQKGPPVNQLVERGYEFLAKGSERLERGCFEDAARDYSLAFQDFQATDHLGGMAQALNNLAVSLLHLGDDGKAELFAKRALDLNRILGHDPGQAANLSVLGGVHLSRGEEGDAVRLLTEALKRAESGPAALRAKIHNDIAVALMRTGKMKDARGHLDAAARLDPGSAAVELNLGRMAQQTGENAAAEAHYKKALSIDRKRGYSPGIAADLTGLGMLYLEADRRGEAAEVLARALALRELLNQVKKADELRDVLKSAGMETGPRERGEGEELPPPACR
jgi:tetratricopeptide (TPR) repeat protein